MNLPERRERATPGRVDFPGQDNDNDNDLRGFRVQPRRRPWWIKALVGTGKVVVPLIMGLTLGLAIDQNSQDKCKTLIGRIAVKMKWDQYYSHCQCMSPALDFSDPCNSFYLGITGIENKLQPLETIASL